MSKLLIDTSIIVDHLRLKNKSQTTFYKLFNDKHDLYISILTHTECYAGKGIWEKQIERNYLKNILIGLKILPLEENISEKAGGIRASYNLGIADAIIAATALFHKLELATLNVKDFKKIAGLKLKNI